MRLSSTSWNPRPDEQGIATGTRAGLEPAPTNWNLTKDEQALKYKTSARWIIFKFLGKLKTLDAYDTSLIIIHADHEAGLPVKMENEGQSEKGISLNPSMKGVMGSAMPLLLIKPLHSKGPLKISSVEAALTDIPATISNLLNLSVEFTGRSVFTLNE